ncbi:MBL fold metallo-hydrolase [Treponema zioleckii]|uniref:MBL fold metallo-hydrolase n=1 Tax=Treponema zioleckii TaxID=331680 RepID=UPI00168B44C8|nr:MBL fold metallo-hydrolase [Treponema zioleckii]
MKPLLIHTGPLNVNTFLIPLCDNKVIIIDPAACAFSGDEQRLETFINKNNFQPIAAIVTHGHFDHVSGLPFLKRKYPEILIGIHEQDAVFLGKNSEKLQDMTLSQMGFEAFLPYVSNLPEPTNILNDGENLATTFSQIQDENLRAALEKWTVIHTPGHTPGAICLYNNDEGLLISGDTLFFQGCGRTDLPGGDEYKLRQSLELLAKKVNPDAKVFPGHDLVEFKLSEGL